MREPLSKFAFRIRSTNRITMKNSNIICNSILFTASSLLAEVSNPVEDYRKIFSELPNREVLIKWECDLNNDGKNEVFITDKTSYDEDVKNHVVPQWLLYISTPTGFVKCDTMHDGNDVESCVLIEINLEAVFSGVISEMESKRGLVMEEIKNPRVGDPVGIIHAYVVEEQYLKHVKLSEYNPTQPNALFTKYLRDGKRTVVQKIEIKQ